MNDRYRDGPERPSSSDDPRSDTHRSDDEFSAAMRRFEKAVDGLATSAKDHFGGRATRFINEATSRIEREATRQTRRQERRQDRQERKRSRNIPEVYLDEPESSAESGATGMNGAEWRGRQHTGRLYRNRYRRKIAGVCGGLAPYLGVHTWVVRGAAITGALFFPMIVIPAYFLAMIFLPEAPKQVEPSSVAAPTRGGEQRSAEVETLGPERQRNVRRDFKDTQALLSQAELRLRRMEAHVTSDRYELQKELHRLEHGGKNGGAVA